MSLLKYYAIVVLHIFSLAISLDHGVADSGGSAAMDPSSLRYFYTDNSMQHSVAFKFLPQFEQRELQEEILHVLGLDHRPKPKKYSTDESASNFLMNLYSSYNDGHTDLNVSNQSLLELSESDVIISFHNQIKTQRNNQHLRHNRDRRFWFNITNVPQNSEIIDAELRIYRDPIRSRFNSSYSFQLTLFQLFDRGQIIKNYVDSIKIDGHAGGWLRFNVTQPLLDWLRFPGQNLGLYLQIRTSSIPKDLSPKSIGLFNSRGFKKYQPFMTAYIKSKTNDLQTPSPNRAEMFENKQRARRAVLNRKRSELSYYDPDDRNPFLNTNDRYISKSCQKRTLFVSFRDLNWQDWIIAPEGYSAFFCHGDCSFPMNTHMNATNHAVVQHLYHIMYRHVPKPCCAPSQLSSIMVLYFDDNSNVVLKKFKNMVVQSCGCH
uniref:Bone morphogenetic protein 7-like n=1 Tax=Dermatophagoides pteronyssinus TaxID=6956 RepID=A0A6P6YA47_DERPT|nr:bone morphogenetic protein 7-like [Dermatophagoides pteronyssinus]XP_027201450.1 bone morphogenetic protein 7-like [Dermatophagoides pteronyssinus]